MITVPSLLNRAGLTQLIASSMAACPLCGDGRLASTVFDAVYAEKPYEERTIYVQTISQSGHRGPPLHRAIGLWYSYRSIPRARRDGMRFDYSWNHPGQHYLNNLPS